MNLWPFKFCRLSIADRLDKLEREMEAARGHIHLLSRLQNSTQTLAIRSARDLAAAIRDAAGKGGAS
jgi:hypothetical protein